MEEIKPIAYSVRFNTINNLDVFVKKSFKELVVDALINLKKSFNMTVHSYVIMSDHISLVVTPENQKNFSLFCDRFKHSVCNKVMELLEGDGFSEKRWLLFLINFINKDNSEGGANKIWTLEYQVKGLHTASEMEEEINQLYQKPVTEGIVSRAEDYNFSSIKENMVELVYFNRQAV